MKKSRYSDSQILNILKQAEDCVPVAQLCREYGTSSATFYKWRSKYGGMDASLITRMKEFGKENYLSQYLFENIDEVQKFATRWLWTYNNERPLCHCVGPRARLDEAA